MSWIFYLSTLLLLSGAAAILFGPSSKRDPQRRLGFAGVLALGTGMLLFLVGLAIVQIY